MICKLFKGSFENFTQAIDSFLVWEGCCLYHTEKKQTLPPLGLSIRYGGFPKIFREITLKQGESNET